MALAFVHVSVVNAAAGSSAVGLSAYMTREERTDATTGKDYDFTDRGSDLVATGVILPDGAPDELKDGGTLWAAATEAETVVDRKTGEVRFSERAGKSPQVAKHFIIALPWDEQVTDSQRIEMTEGFIRDQFGAAGVAVEFAVHRYGTEFKPEDAATNAEVKKQIELIDGMKLEKIRLTSGDPMPTDIRGPHALVWDMPDGSERWQLYQPHAHVLVSTRRVEPTGFRTAKGRPTEKARELNPDFGKGGRVTEEQGWRHRWRDYQNGYFAERGMDVTVMEERAVPEKHRGKARSTGSATSIENADRDAERQEVALDPDAMLDHLTKHQSTFTHRDVVNALRRHGVPNAEIEEAADRIIINNQVVMLVDKASGETIGVMTTREVREEEESAFAAWMALAARRYPISDAAKARAVEGLDGEQADAFRHSLGGAGAVVMQGDPGTGKSFTMKRIRVALEMDGVTCWGASTMNAVARDMAAEAGFKNADTLAAFVGRLEDGRLTLHGRTAIIVDEAAMTDNTMLGRLARQALRFNAPVIIVGDDKQNAAVARGGLYTDIREALGAARLSEVRRHIEDWQKRATKDLAAGNVAAGIAAYDQQGRVKWTGTLDEARAALVEHAKAIMAKDQEVYVLASTNVQKDKINPEIRAARNLPPGVVVNSKQGLIEVSQGERIQLYGSRKREGLYNSTFGTVEHITQNGVMSVLFDDGRKATIDTRKWRDFGYGYAGTVYRDQGKTRREILALYDSKFMWGKETTLVGLSRQKEDVHLYVPGELAADREKLATQMSRSRAKASSLKWATPNQVERISAVPTAPAPPPPEAAPAKPVAPQDPKAEAARREANDTLRQVMAAMAAWRQARASGDVTRAGELATALLAAHKVERQAKKGTKPVTRAIMKAGAPWKEMQADANRLKREQAAAKIKAVGQGIVTGGQAVRQAVVTRLDTLATKAEVWVAKRKQVGQEQAEAEAKEQARQERLAQREAQIDAREVRVGITDWQTIRRGAIQAEIGDMTAVVEGAKWALWRGDEVIAHGAAKGPLGAREQTVAAIEQAQALAADAARQAEAAQVQDTWLRYMEAAQQQNAIIEHGGHLKVAYWAAGDLFKYPEQANLDRTELDVILKPLWEQQERATTYSTATEHTDDGPSM